MFILAELKPLVYPDCKNQGPCRIAGPFQLSTDNHYGLPYQNILTTGLDFCYYYLVEYLRQIIGKIIPDLLQQLNREREIKNELSGVWNLDGRRRLRGRIG
jgi:hypothetical protein